MVSESLLLLLVALLTFIVHVTFVSLYKGICISCVEARAYIYIYTPTIKLIFPYFFILYQILIHKVYCHMILVGLFYYFPFFSHFCFLFPKGFFFFFGYLIVICPFKPFKETCISFTTFKKIKYLFLILFVSVSKKVLYTILFFHFLFLDSSFLLHIFLTSYSLVIMQICAFSLTYS